MKVLAGLTGAALVLGLSPVVAAADVSPVGVGVVRGNDWQRGTFTVPVWTDAAGESITSVSATIRDGATTVDTVALVDQDGAYWAPAAPLKLTEDSGTIPALGRYAIDVSATDSHGNSTTRVGAGTLDFTLRPELDPIAFTRPSLDSAHRSIGVTGVLLGVQPGSLQPVPLAGRTVSVTRSYTDTMPNRAADATVQATTDGQGAFATAEAPQLWSATYRSSFTADDSEVHGTATEHGYPSITQANVTMSAKANRTLAEPGQPVTITGSVRNGSAPVAGVTVQLSMSSYDNGLEPARSVTTDSNGNFSGVITAVSGSYVTWRATIYDAYVTGEASGDLTVPSEASYTGVSIGRPANGRVTASGTLTPTYAPNQAIYQAPVSYLQYSRDGRSGWANLARATPADTYSPVRVSAWGYSDGYYRLYHPTSTELDRAVSATVHRSRIPTRIAGNDAGPEPVKVGRTVTVTGTLQEYRSRAWRAFARRPIELWFLAKGAKRWTYVTSGTTDARGRAVLRGKATKDGRWLLQYWADAAHFNSGGTSDYVDTR